MLPNPDRNLSEFEALLCSKETAVALRGPLTEGSLRDGEQLFRELAEFVPQIVWVADRDGSVYWCNQLWYRYTGMSAEESAGGGWVKAVHPDHADHVLRSVQHALDTGEPFEAIFLMRSATGDYRWVISRA